MDSHLIIGITGTQGAGKGTISKLLCNNKGFKHLSVREYLSKLLIKDGKELSRSNMLSLANHLRSQYSAEYIVMELYKEAIKSNHNCIIESVRTVGEVKALKRQNNFKLWAIDAPTEIRYQRVVKRGSSTDNIPTLNEFKKEEAKELRSNDPKKGNIFGCMKLAEVTFINDGTVTQLEQKVLKVLKML